MTSKDERVRAAIAEQASEWFVANDDAPLDTAESAAFIAWLRVSPVHVEEFLRVAGVARDLRTVATDPEYSMEALLAGAHAEDNNPVRPFRPGVLTAVRAAAARRWLPAAITVVAIGVASFGLMLWNLRPLARAPVPVSTTALHFETRHGEQQTYRLTDKSVLHLNTDSAVTVRYSPSQRLVVVTTGEAEFEVFPEPSRPFHVLAGAAEVVDLGTKFDVRLRQDLTVVTVVEGRVAVEPSPMRGKGGTGSSQGQPPQSVQLGANQQLSVSPANWPAIPVVVDAQRTTSWLHRQIAFDHEPLGRVVAEFNRYAPKPIEITTPRLRDLEVSGVFSTDDTQEFLAFLRSLEGVSVEVTATRIRVSQK